MALDYIWVAHCRMNKCKIYYDRDFLLQTIKKILMLFEINRYFRLSRESLLSILDFRKKFKTGAIQTLLLLNGILRHYENNLTNNNNNNKIIPFMHLHFAKRCSLQPSKLRCSPISSQL